MPLIVDDNILPDDDSTLFLCSGMQRFKHRFSPPDGSSDGGRLGTVQGCIRTDDLELVGDGSHLTSFQMVGNFSFGNDDYEQSVELWRGIVNDLRIPVDEVRVHPSRSDHRRMWESRGFRTRSDESCVWSDGQIGGHCCELFVGDLEIGNLVNPRGGSTDVGFGLERLCQVVEGSSRVDETEHYRSSVRDGSGLPLRLDPVLSDHLRTVTRFLKNHVSPGPRGRSYVCRRLLRRMLRRLPEGWRRERPFEVQDWLEQEDELRQRSLREGRRHWRKFRDRPPEFWRETFGILPEELDLLP